MKLASTIVQYEVSDTSPSHFLVFIHNETCDHFYFVHSFSGDIVVIKNGSETKTVIDFEQVEEKLKADGWLSSNVYEDESEMEIGNEVDVRNFLGKVINARHLKTFLSVLHTSHSEQMKKKGINIPSHNYTSWGDWS